MSDADVPVKAKKIQLCKVSMMGGRRKGGATANVECIEDDENNVDKVFNGLKEAKKAESQPESQAESQPESNAAQGGADIKTKYKKTLNKKTVEELRKMAKRKGIKITTKKDGKSAYLKKASIINKLCDIKHPKKK